jgi:hypothetical protein
MNIITDSMVPLLLQLVPGFVRESVRDFQLEQAVAIVNIVAAANVAGGASQSMRRRIFFQSMN